jgi:hypothetical protein
MKFLGQGGTWPEALDDAMKHNREIPQPALEFPQPAVAGEEFIEEFCQAMRQRDLFTEFLLWYGEKSDHEPEMYPRSMNRLAWLELLGKFIDGLSGV